MDYLTGQDADGFDLAVYMQASLDAGMAPPSTTK